MCGPSYDGVAWEWLLEPSAATTKTVHDVIHQHGTEMLNNDDHTQAERLAIAGTKNYQYCIECLRIGIAAAEAAGDHRKAEKLQEQYDRLIS